MQAMSLRDARHRISRGLPGAAAAVTARLPLPIAESVGRGLGALTGVVPNRLYRRALDNLRFAFPEQPESTRAELARRSLAHAGRELAATLRWFSRGSAALPGLCTNYGELCATLRSDLAAGRGAIWVGSHLGNPQLLSGLCATVAPVTGVHTGYHARSQFGFVAEARARVGLRHIPANAPPLELLRALQRNELVSILPDVQPRRNVGVWLPFFGRPACTSTFAASLARLTGSVLRPVFLVREGDRYRALIRDRLAPPRADEGDAGLERAMLAWSAALEEEVRRRPEQWIWINRRWRDLPDGARPVATPAARVAQAS
ncbi:MAG TPA: hypothetical protein VFD43_02495 [Planctomycetota bacterium]|nr:hypothetical protein [Planctomycetota bacterium]